MKNEEDKIKKLKRFFTNDNSSSSSSPTTTISFQTIKCLQESISEKELNQIESLYKELDTSNSNSINLDQFLSEIIKRSLINIETMVPRSSITGNIPPSRVINIFNTKCERIIRLLKEMKITAKAENDQISMNNIDCIISTLNEENIYEMDNDVYDKDEKMTDEFKNGLNFLAKYSKMELIHAKTKDFNLLRTSTRSKTITTERSEHLKKMEQMEKLHRKTIGISMVISPSISAKISNLMSRLPYYDFDVFALDDLITNKSSVYVAKEILGTLKMIQNDEIISEEKLNSFLEKVAISYDRKKAIYHNDLHAADVMQTLYCIFFHGHLDEKMQLKELDKFAILIGAFCHDLKHTGQNNIFHVNSRSKIALRYNDNCVLENFHIAQSFKILQDPNFDIFSLFKPEEYRNVRRRMIDGIISTDMSNHTKVLSSIKSKIELLKIEKGTNFEKMFVADNISLFDSQQTVLNMALHSSDISNPAKPSKISDTWTKMVYDEFFLQGDLEKKLTLPVSMLCDRETTDISKAMIGFIKFVVGPTFDVLVNLIPEIGDYSNYIKANLKKYELAVEKDSKKA